MGQAEPAELEKIVAARLTALLVSCGHLRGPTTFERARFERDLDSIEKHDAALAFTLRGVLAQLDGDIESVEQNVAKARHLNARGVDIILADAYSNLGFATRSLSLLREKMRAGVPDLSAYFSSALNSGAAVTMMSVVDQTQSVGQGLSQRANDLLPIARKIAATLADVGHTEDELALVLDVAGEVLREHKLLWLDDMPQIIVERNDSEESAPGVHYYYRVDVSPQEAAALSGDIAWRLIDRDLAFPSMTVSLVGARQEALTA